MKREELIPLFSEGDKALYHGEVVRVLRVNTYCRCCDRFLDEASYSITGDFGTAHRVPESLLQAKPRNFTPKMDNFVTSSSYEGIEIRDYKKNPVTLQELRDKYSKY